jgi:transmembrane sensor
MPTSFDPRDSGIIQWIRNHRTSDEPRFDSDAAWSRFRREHVVRAPRKRGVFGQQSLVWRIAAVLLLAVGGAMYWHARQPSAAPTIVERVAANGQRSTITLDEETRITLNGGSRLRYTDGSATRDREVFLDGEAFFEVTHNPSRTFRVHAGRGVIEDVGTRFNIRAYSGAPTVEVVVTEGSVTFARDSSPGRPLQLNRGEAATLGESGPPAKLTIASIDRYIGWTTGSLVFDNTTLRDAAAELEHRYGVRIDVDPRLATRSVTARFHGESVDQVLDAITVALGARYERTDSTYSIRPRIR